MDGTTTQAGGGSDEKEGTGLMRMIRRGWFGGVLLALVFVPTLSVGAQTQEGLARFAPVAPSERIPNLDTLKDELKQYHACTCTCGCYAKDLDLQAERAIAFLRLRTARRRPNERLAVVLDIDETTLSNYEEMEKAGFAYDAKAFNAYVDSAKAPAIPGTLRIFNEAKRLGVHAFFLTGRGEAERGATEQNLRAQGFDGWQELILRKPGQGSSTALDYKSAARAGLVAEGYKIILNVGDQWSDLRGNPEAEYSVKYPDPYYFLK
jgi:acid phosphatase